MFLLFPRSYISVIEHELIYYLHLGRNEENNTEHLKTLGRLRLSESLLERCNCLVDVVAAGVSDADAHVAEADVLGRDLLVQAGRENHAALQQERQDVRRGQALGQADRGHGVRLVLGLCGQLGQAQLGDGGLDAVGDLGVDGEALRQRLGGDLGQGGVEGADELGRRRREVRGLAGLVVLHDGQPVGHGGVVGQRRGLARLEAVDGALRHHQDAEARRAADGLLAGGQDDVQVPRVEGDLLAADAAHAVDDDQRLRADAAHELRDGLDVAQHARRGVDVRDGDDLVRLLLEGLLDLRERGPLTDRGLELRGAHAVRFQTGGERVAEVARVQDEGVLARLDQVRGHDVPAQGAAAGDDERLRGGVGGLEELAQEGQGLAKDLDEGGPDVRLAGGIVR